MSRKLVAFAQSEDELAGVLAHEMGHLVARHHTIAISRQLKEALRVTEVGDRNDIFEKYHRLLESEERKPGAFRSNAGHDSQDQIAADRIGLFAAAGAGYDPSAMANLWDRYAGTEGNTGSFFSDFFGRTTPETKRFRALIKTLGSLPASCVDARATDVNTAFRDWRSAVLVYSGPRRKESLHGVLSKTPLDPPLRGELTHLRFSPDGKRLLAQDESGISVLSREPFRPLFRINAPDANRAQFTPDSASIVFHNADLRVERYSAADGKLEDARELVIRTVCVQTNLSPDGATFACLDNDFTLNLFETATGAPVYRKKNFYTVDRLSLLQLLSSGSLSVGLESENTSLLDMEFSTDGRFFIASQRNLEPLPNVVAFDTRTRASFSLGGTVQKMISSGFVFTDADRLLAYNVGDPSRSAVIALPKGDIESRVPFISNPNTQSRIVSRISTLSGRLTTVTRGNYLLVRSVVDKYPISVMRMDNGSTIKASELPALDVYDGTLVAERLNGELGLYALDTGDLQVSALPPGAVLGPLRTVSVSPDFEWLAASEGTRGAVWELQKGARTLFVRGFRSAVIGSDGMLTADFPRFRQGERQLGRFDLKRSPVAGIFREESDLRVKTYGNLRLTVRPAKQGGGAYADIVIEARAEPTLQTLWSRAFPNEAPNMWVDPTHDALILMWSALSKSAQAVIKGSPVLTAQYKTVRDRNNYLIEVLDLGSGKVRGQLFVDTGKGSFDVAAVLSAGDWLAITDNRNRVLIYSLKSGEKKGQVFGSRVALSAASGLVSVENEDGQLTLYDLATLRKRDVFEFAQRIALARFSPDGTRLFVLAADQTAYVLDVTSSSRN
jgi:WD40 repeat protein